MMIRLFTQTGDIANAPLHKSDPFEVPDDISEDELDEMGKEFMWDQLQPEFYHEVVEEE